MFVFLQQPVSADALIENLLGKKETFKPKPAHHTFQPANQAIAQVMSFMEFRKGEKITEEECITNISRESILVSLVNIS